jgi:colicin import membrane protein
MAKLSRTRTSKQEVVEAYDQTLAKQVESTVTDARDHKKQADEAKVREAATASNVEKIVQELATLRLGILKSLDTLGEQLIGEQQRLTQLKSAVELEQQSLQELYGIKAEADSLAALMTAQKEKQEAFDTEMATARAKWKTELEQAEAAKKEFEIQLKKDRDRERDDYSYKLSFDRKKEEDAYKQRKEALEKELIERKKAFTTEIEVREKAVVEQEKELAELRSLASGFPDKLAKAVAEAENAVMRRMEEKHSYEINLRAKESEGEKKLLEQAVTSLQQKVKEIESLNADLSQRMTDSQQKVHAIALKALETSAFSRPGQSSERPIDLPKQSI